MLWVRRRPPAPRRKTSRQGRGGEPEAAAAEDGARQAAGRQGHDGHVPTRRMETPAGRPSRRTRGQEPIKTTGQPAPGAGKLPVIPDRDELVPMSPEEAAAHLRDASRESLTRGAPIARDRGGRRKEECATTNTCTRQGCPIVDRRVGRAVRDPPIPVVWWVSHRSTHPTVEPPDWTPSPGACIRGSADVGRESIHRKHSASVARSAVLLALRSAVRAADDDDPPAVGQPDYFNGAVGKFGVATAADPRQVQAEDPITYTVHVTADQLKQPPKRPVLADFPDFKEGFYIEDIAPPEGNHPDEKTWEFVYRLKPKNTTITAIPGFPFVFYRPGPGYQTKFAPEIEIGVVPRKPVDPGPSAARPMAGPEAAFSLADGDALRREDERLPGLVVLILALPGRAGRLCRLGISSGAASIRTRLAALADAAAGPLKRRCAHCSDIAGRRITRAAARRAAAVVARYLQHAWNGRSSSRRRRKSNRICGRSASRRSSPDRRPICCGPAPRCASIPNGRRTPS